MSLGADAVEPLERRAGRERAALSDTARNRGDGRAGLAAMQAINRAAPSPLFMTALFGTAASAVGLGVVAIQRRDDPRSTYLLIGAGLYLAGIILTIAYHVPHNDALALVDPTSSGAAATWHHYVTNWTLWNHVRTLTSIAGATMLVLALNAE